MEFYARREFENFCKESFNSQRDGILPKVSQFSGIVSMFQFPTGWNSAISRFYYVWLYRLFQFPTVWNSTMTADLAFAIGGSFNSQRDGILRRPVSLASIKAKRFNSQRDGILLNIERILFFARHVSIPNGMEFYPHKLHCVGSRRSFNSQRDGILQCHYYREPYFPRRFQFPTGWNSTLLVKFFQIIAISVSIPNGMEFYSLSFWLLIVS